MLRPSLSLYEHPQFVVVVAEVDVLAWPPVVVLPGGLFRFLLCGLSQPVVVEIA